MEYYKTNTLEHHGIKGMHWGVRNGPPYPLSSKQKSASERKGTPSKGAVVKKKVTGGSVSSGTGSGINKASNKQLIDELKKKDGLNTWNHNLSMDSVDTLKREFSKQLGEERITEIRNAAKQEAEWSKDEGRKARNEQYWKKINSMPDDMDFEQFKKDNSELVRQHDEDNAKFNKLTNAAERAINKAAKELVGETNGYYDEARFAIRQLSRADSTSGKTGAMPKDDIRRLDSMTTKEIQDDNVRVAAERLYIKNRTPQPDKKALANADYASQIANAARTATDNLQRSADSAYKDAVTRKKAEIDLSNLSDDDLRKAVNRMNLERQYRDLTPVEVKSGEEKFKQAMDIIGPVVATAASVVTIAAMVYKITNG